MSYANIEELAAFMSVDSGSLPADSQRMLDRASELIDYVTHERIDAAVPGIRTAARDAACAQVEYWIADGESELYPALKSKTVGKVTMTYANTDRGTFGCEDLSPRARRFLFRRGLLNRKVGLR